MSEKNGRKCTRCGGTGRENVYYVQQDKSAWITCRKCGGTGK
jgi:predicted nucleic-acid-binding Zn-ribbon protein